MFGHKAQPTRVYNYGCKPPTTNQDLIIQQLKLANDYRNALVENELKRRAAKQQARLDAYPQLQEYQQQLEGIRTQIEEQRAQILTVNKAARKKVPQPDRNRSIKELRAQLKPIYQAEKALRSQANEDEALHATWDKIDQDFGVKHIREKFADRLYHGTYQIVEQTVPRSGNPPRFRRWTGEGRISVYCQEGLEPAATFLGEDRRIRIDPLPNNAFESPPRFRKTTARFRVQSDTTGKPIWAEIPFKMHRPLPPDSKIRRVWLVRRKIATHYKWFLQFIVSKPQWEQQGAETGRVGIDVGWRLVPTGLRIAFWAGSDGATGQVIIPTNMVNRWKKVEELQSIRSNNYNHILVRFREWLGATETLPDWLKERTRTIAHWKGNSEARLAGAVVFWRTNRFDGDVPIFDELEAWRKQDKHLYEWQENQRQNCRLWREWFFRNEIRGLSRQYHTAVIENTDWGELRKNAPPEESDSVNKVYRNIASVGRYLQLVREVMLETVAEEAADTTLLCHHCGHLCDFNKEHLEHTCENCLAVWDQDENAAINLLRGKPKVRATA